MKKSIKEKLSHPLIIGGALLLILVVIFASQNMKTTGQATAGMQITAPSELYKTNSLPNPVDSSCQPGQVCDIFICENRGREPIVFKYQKEVTLNAKNPMNANENFYNKNIYQGVEWRWITDSNNKLVLKPTYMGFAYCDVNVNTIGYFQCEGVEFALDGSKKDVVWQECKCLTCGKDEVPKSPVPKATVPTSEKCIDPSKLKTCVCECEGDVCKVVNQENKIPKLANNQQPTGTQQIEELPQLNILS